MQIEISPDEISTVTIIWVRNLEAAMDLHDPFNAEYEHGATPVIIQVWDGLDALLTPEAESEAMWSADHYICNHAH